MIAISIPEAFGFSISRLPDPVQIARTDNFNPSWTARAQVRAGWPHHANGRSHARPWRMDRLLGPKNIKRGFDRQ